MTSDLFEPSLETRSTYSAIHGCLRIAKDDLSGKIDRNSIARHTKSLDSERLGAISRSLKEYIFREISHIKVPVTIDGIDGIDTLNYETTRSLLAIGGERHGGCCKRDPRSTTTSLRRRERASESEREGE